MCHPARVGTTRLPLVHQRFLNAPRRPLPLNIRNHPLKIIRSPNPLHAPRLRPERLPLRQRPPLRQPLAKPPLQPTPNILPSHRRTQHHMHMIRTRRASKQPPPAAQTDRRNQPLCRHHLLTRKHARLKPKILPLDLLPLPIPPHDRLPINIMCPLHRPPRIPMQPRTVSPKRNVMRQRSVHGKSPRSSKPRGESGRADPHFKCQSYRILNHTPKILHPRATSQPMHSRKWRVGVCHPAHGSPDSTPTPIISPSPAAHLSSARAAIAPPPSLPNAQNQAAL